MLKGSKSNPQIMVNYNVIQGNKLLEFRRESLGRLKINIEHTVVISQINVIFLCHKAMCY